MARFGGRRLWLKAHLWLGLLFALPVVVLGVTGAVLAFLPEIQAAIEPETYAVEAEGEPLPLADVVRRIRAQHPDLHLFHVTVHREPDRRWIGYASGGRLYVDPYTGDAAFVQSGAGVLAWVERIHRDLGAGAWGSRLAGLSSIVLVVLSMTGVYLWWPMRSGSLRRLLRGRVALGWHNLTGLVFLPLLLAMGLTGAFLTFGNPLIPAVYAVTGSPPFPDPPKASGAYEEPSVSLAKAVERVQDAYPGAVVTAFGDPPGDRGAYRVNLGRPGEVNEHGWERVFVDPTTGEVLAHRNTRTHSPGSAFQHSWWALHTAEIFGPGLRLLWAVASFAVAPLLLTGVWLWWRKKIGRSRRTEREDAAREPIVEVVVR